MSNSLEAIRKADKTPKRKKTPIELTVDVPSLPKSTKASRKMTLNSHRVSSDGRKLVDLGTGVPKIPMPNMGPTFGPDAYADMAVNSVEFLKNPHPSLKKNERGSLNL